MSRLVFIFTVLIFLERVDLEKVVKFSSIYCDHDADYLTNFTCTLKVKGRNLVVANTQFDLMVKLKSVTLHMELVKLENRLQPHILNSTFRICDAMGPNSIVNNALFVKTVLAAFKEYSNLVVCVHEVGFHIE